MIAPIFYSIVLCLSLGFFLIGPQRKYKILGIILISEYFFISVCSIVMFANNYTDYSRVTLLPYIVLLVSYTLTFSPFLSLRNNFKVDKIDIKFHKVYYYLAIIYIGFSLVSILIYLPKVNEIITQNDWAMQRLLYYRGEQTQVYTNFFERMSLNFVNYFKLFALLIYFILLKYDIKKRFRLVLLICIISNVFLSAINSVSRGSIFDFFILFIAIFLFFRNGLSIKIKKSLTILIISIGVIFGFYALSVTISRFSSSNSLDASSLDSLIDYFGQAPLVFNQGVYPVVNHTYGVYSFGKLFELFGTEIYYPHQSEIGGSWGSGFYTYVGLIFIDFGISGVIIHGLFIHFILSYFIKKNKFKLSDMFLIFLIYEYLLKGGFVIGRNYIVGLLVLISIYTAMCFIEKIKISESSNNYINLSSNK